MRFHVETAPQIRWQLADGKPVNIFERPEANKIVEKLSQFEKLDNLFLVTQGTKPFQVGKGVPKQTREIVDAKPYVSDKKRDSTFRPLLRGSLIQRYQILWSEDYWISFGPWLAEPRTSASYDACEKILIRQTGDSFIATIDRDKFIARDNLYTIVPRKSEFNLTVLLAVLNSRFASWFYQNTINPERGEALAQVKRGHLAIFPIPQNVVNPANEFDVEKHDRMVSLVEKMLALVPKRRAESNPQVTAQLDAQISATDRQIDRLVYDLYGLTEDEIALVEGS